MRRLLAVLALAAVSGEAQSQAAIEMRFVACPVYRDTDAGRKSGCWLADEPISGRRFDISRGPSKPDWNHQVLVEGRVAPDGTGDPCGGTVLDPVRTSVLEAPCTRHMLPGEGYAGNKFALPRRNVDPMAKPRTPPTAPFADRSFHLFFGFDQDFVMYQYDDFLLDRAITYIRGVPYKRITVTGWAATDPIEVSGTRIAETPAIARARAERIAEALGRLGVPRERISVRWKDGAQPIDDPEADGLADQSRRRVDIDVALEG